ncbi:MAG TPA: nucleotide sugar dehydrogenase [Rhizomicrobium sp.]
MNVRISLKSNTELEHKLEAKTVTVGVIGLGYVGLPLVHVFWQAGIKVIGFDIDPAKIIKLDRGESYISHFAHERIVKMNDSGRFRATGDFSDLGTCDAILICVPTPITATREPDLSFVVDTAEVIARHLRKETLVVLESTTYPGTTQEVVLPILEKSGLSAGNDFYLAFSPEREDPGSVIETKAIPKIVGGTDPYSGELAARLYSLGFSQIHKVSDAQTAEAVKITENIFRAVNIALVNELKLAYSNMGINIWDVIEAAKTKPFGYMAFYPGPGLGGHCIPIDPFYLSWRARAFEVETKFIELAGEINRAMPRIVVQTLINALSERQAKAIKNAKILVLGVAYKKNVDDTRESPALHIIHMLRELGAEVDYYDPYVPEIPRTREYAHLASLKRISFEESTIAQYNAALIVTDHDNVDYNALVRWSRLVVDTRNATRNAKEDGHKIVRA